MRRFGGAASVLHPLSSDAEQDAPELPMVLLGV
jgi:hypothetical protein